MKRLLISVIFLLMMVIGMAIPNGKYQDKNGDYIIVSGNRFSLYIGGNYAVSLIILEEDEDGGFTYIVEGKDTVRSGKWYTSSDGNTYISLGSKNLKKVN